MNVELLIGDGSGERVYLPPVREGIEWSTERRGTPGRLTFKVLKDDILNFTEGCPVRMRVDQQNLFYGFVFKQSRNKDGMITVTAYDQLRYLKNKDSAVYENRKASELVKLLAGMYSLNMGAVEDTGYVIASRVEENKSLFEMIENALDLTLTNTKELFILYDDFGRLTLKNLSGMYVGSPGAYLLIDGETGENFDYSSSIDDNTYNQIKLISSNEKGGGQRIFTSRDPENTAAWGVLQYCDTLQGGENGQAKADALLELYNKKTRNLKINKAIGDVRVRGGSMVCVRLALGDMQLSNFMLAERVRHTFDDGGHRMDLTLRGGEFIA